MGGRMTHNISRQSSVGTAQNSLAIRLHMLFHGLAFVGGFTFVFVVIGILTTALVSVAGQYVNTFTEIIGRIGGVVIIFFGLQFMGLLPKFFKALRTKNLNNPLVSIGFALVASLLLYWGFLEQIFLALPFIAALVLVMFINDAFTNPANFWDSVLSRIELMLYSDTRGDIEPSGREGLLGSAFMGMVFSAGWTPCIGPLLGTILTVAATTGDVAQGMIMLTAYSIGLGIPFVITALLMNSAQGLLRGLQRRMQAIELFSGALLVIIGIMVASGQLQSLSRTFSQGEFADFTFRVEECGVGFFDGELEFSHVGACINGQLVPIVINQSASGSFSMEMPTQEYLFHAEAGDAIDFEVRSTNSDVVDFHATLYAPDDTILIDANKSDSVISDERYFPIVDFTLEESGIYRIAITNESDQVDARFRVKVRHAEPIDNAQSASLNSLTDVADTLAPAIGLAEGNRAPDFTVQGVNSNAITLSDLQGNVVLLNFWGTWCGPCRTEMPEFQQAYEQFQADGFEILAVAFEDTVENIELFRDEFGLSFTLALDESGDIIDTYGVQNLPSSFLLDKDGIILMRQYGMMTQEQIQAVLSDALATE
jgi:cytochrome c-type biogenesis protein